MGASHGAVGTRKIQRLGGCTTGASFSRVRIQQLYILMNKANGEEDDGGMRVTMDFVIDVNACLYIKMNHLVLLASHNLR